MPKKSTLTSAKEASEKIKELSNSEGLEKLENIAEKLSLKKKADHALDLKDVTNKSFLEKKELIAETKHNKKKPWWKKGMTAGLAGGFGLMLGKGKESKEFTKQATDVAVGSAELMTNEEELKKANDTFETAIEADRKIKEVNKDINKKWNFKDKEINKNWFEELKKREEKYKKYDHKDAWKDAWSNTEFEYNSDTGEKTKRNFFFRLLAFFPALTKTYTSWKSFEKLKKSGAIEKVKEGKKYKDEVDKEVKDAEKKINKGMEAKKEVFSSVFEENPGALQISKKYFKQLANLTRNADKYSSAERAALIKKYVKEAASKGTKEFGEDFIKMKG